MRALLVVFFVFSSIAFPSTAATLLSVTGTDNSDIGIGPDEAVAVSFTTTQSFSNATFSVPVSDLICLNCVGEVYLELGGLGSSATIGNLIDAQPFNSTGPLSFTEANLASGAYYVVLAITTGNAVWTGSTSPVVTTVPNVTHFIDYMATSIDSGFPPASAFTAITVSDRFYQLTTPVPVPGAAILTGTALAFLIGLRRRRVFPS
jgi:hypothetical protein